MTRKVSTDRSNWGTDEKGEPILLGAVKMTGWLGKVDGVQVKRDLSDAVITAVTDYATSVRGCAALGSKTTVMRVPGTNTIQVSASTLAGPAFFEIVVKQASA